MNTTMSRGLTRLVAGPVVAAGIIGGALGLAAVANASTDPTPPAQPTIVYPHAVQTQPMQPRIDTGPTRAVDPDGPLDPPGTASAPSNMLGDR